MAGISIFNASGYKHRHPVPVDQALFQFSLLSIHVTLLSIREHQICGLCQCLDFVRCGTALSRLTDIVVESHEGSCKLSAIFHQDCDLGSDTLVDELYFHISGEHGCMRLVCNGWLPRGRRVVDIVVIGC